MNSQSFHTMRRSVSPLIGGLAGLLLALPVQAQPPADANHPMESDIKRQLEGLLQNSNVTVEVIKLANIKGQPRFAVRLANKKKIEKINNVDTEVEIAIPATEKTALVALVAGVYPDMLINDLGIKLTSAASAPKTITRIWPLMFLRGALPNKASDEATTAADTISAGTDAAAAAFATELQKLYPAPSPMVFTAQENRLLIQGPEKEVQKIRAMLALYLDVPSPQVRADVWTIQVNSRSTKAGSRERALRKMNEIRAGVQIVRDLHRAARMELALYLKQTAAKNNLLRSDPPNEALEYRSLLDGVGFKREAARPLSMPEIMIFLGFLERREDFIEALVPTANLNLPNKPEPGYLAGRLESLLNRVTDAIKKEGTLQSKTNRPDIPSSYPQSAPGSLNATLQMLDNYDDLPAARVNLLHLVNKIRDRIKLARETRTEILPRFARQYYTDLEEIDARTLKHFLEAWINCTDAYQNGTNDEQKSSKLVHAGAAADQWLKQAMDALTADIQDLFISPLLDWVRTDIQRGSAERSGVDLVGTTSVVVRNRTLASVYGQSEVFYPYTPRPKLTQKNLEDAQTLSAGTPAAAGVAQEEYIARDSQGEIIMDKDGNPLVLTRDKRVEMGADGKPLRGKDNQPITLKTGVEALAKTALGALNPFQALLLTAAFNDDTAVPQFRRVAPGVSLAIRPFVLPDGGSARVQMVLSNTIDTGGTDKADYKPGEGGTVDAIKTHTTRTEATINAFELMELTTLGIQTTAKGDVSWRIPIIEQIPIIGPLFRGPRNTDTRRQESIAIVNLSILPRALDLVPYLNSSSASAAGGGGGLTVPSDKSGQPK